MKQIIPLIISCTLFLPCVAEESFDIIKAKQDCIQAYEKAYQKRSAIDDELYRFNNDILIVNYKGVITRGSEKRISNFVKGGLFKSDGVMLDNDSMLVYDSNAKKYISGEVFVGKPVFYKRVDNYQYKTHFGDIKSIPAFKPTRYKLSSVNPRNYKTNKDLVCCQVEYTPTLFSAAEHSVAIGAYNATTDKCEIDKDMSNFGPGLISTTQW